MCRGEDGNFYVTANGSPGVIERLTPAGNPTLLYYFDSATGDAPIAGLTQGSDGKFYGTTTMGGPNSNEGVIYVLTVAPIITSPTAASGNVGTAFSYQVTASDRPEVFSATGLGGGLRFDAATARIVGTPTAATTLAAAITATNSGGSDTRVVSITIGGPGPLPAITSANTAQARVGVSFAYQITVTNLTAGNKASGFAASGLPPGLRVDAATGRITGTPATAEVYPVMLTATNPDGSGRGRVVITVKPPVPLITSALTAEGTQRRTFGYTITASGGPTSFGAAGLPAGLKLNQVTGEISGLPAAAPGMYAVRIAAFNGGGSNSATLRLTIHPGPPMITSALTAAGMTANAFSYRIAATNQPTLYGESGLPGGLAIDQATGVLSGIPKAVGVYQITIAAFNDVGGTSETLVLTVTSGAPKITSGAQQFTLAGNAFQYQITATGSPARYGASGLPAGVKIDQATGIISGTVTAPGVYTVTMAAFNAAGSGTAQLTIIVSAPS